MVSGKYIGNGKPAPLAFARVIPHEKWQDETAYTLILTEKDASKVDKPDFDAMFGKLGHALVINVTQSGSIFGTQVCHQALEKTGFSSIGPIKIERFSAAGGKLSGHFFTEGEQEFSGDKWLVDVKDVRCRDQRPRARLAPGDHAVSGAVVGRVDVGEELARIAQVGSESASRRRTSMSAWARRCSASSPRRDLGLERRQRGRAIERAERLDPTGVPRHHPVAGLARRSAAAARPARAAGRRRARAARARAAAARRRGRRRRALPRTVGRRFDAGDDPASGVGDDHFGADLGEHPMRALDQRLAVEHRERLVAAEAAGRAAGDHDAHERRVSISRRFELPPEDPCSNVFSCCPWFSSSPRRCRPAAQSPKVTINTNLGKIVVELDSAKAPKSVENFLAYVDAKFYDGTIFHRVIDGFMIQGGGHTKDMQRKTTREPVVNESKNGLSNARGTIAMARTNDPNSATSQFFINRSTTQGLDAGKTGDGGYTVFGKVTEGMDVVDKISKVKTTSVAGNQNVPVEPVIIESITRVQ